MTQEEHDKFMHRLLEEKKELRKKRKQRLQQQRSREKQTEEEKQRKEEEQKQRKVDEKKKDLNERLIAIDQYRRRRATEMDVANQAVVALKRTDTLHQRLMANFLSTEANALEEKKKKLA